MKVAIVHDQLQEFGGAERVLVALKEIFPKAHVITSFYNPKTLGVHAKKFKDWRITTSWVNKIPGLNRLYSPLRFITPLIWENFDFSKYDLVISSSGAYMSKGIITKPSTPHICYLHHQPRYLYYYETAIEWQKYLPVKIYGHLINHSLRIWDYLSSQRVDYFIANSEETRLRIKKFYRRDATVIYPPVNVPQLLQDFGGQAKKTSNYYLIISRLARVKHIDILIKAANKAKFYLKIVGQGRDYQYLKSISGPTIEFLGSIDDSDLSELYLKAKAFLFAAVDEEFGIAPVEAMGYGLPVIAYASGGLKETVKTGINGYLFNELHEDSLIKNIRTLEQLPQDAYLEMRKQARKISGNFSQEKFKEKIIKFVSQKFHPAKSTDPNRQAD